MSELQDRTPANRRAARIVTATVVAGGIALAGGTAYADANSADEVPPRAASAASEPVEPVEPATGFVDEPVDPDQASREVFFAAGYTYDDAVVLGEQWAQDPWEAKVTGGEELAAGKTLPIAPGSSAPAPAVPVSEVPAEESAAVDAFFAAGYTYDDAVALGAVWHVDPYEAKVTGGRELLTGGTLPVAP
ncbi:hypothetical protein [Kineococcus sp. SYSU DK002]|uniref:hypothetical protein n=1 Tax=Kineococcus sp. SYSU DK002 TaxID=3383123 RepID=UPI003D7D9A82